MMDKREAKQLRKQQAEILFPLIFIPAASLIKK